MAGIKLTTNDLMPTQQMQPMANVMQRPFQQETNFMDGVINILTRVERITNSPAIKPLIEQAVKKWEAQQQIEQPIQQQYNNPQVWEQPPAPQQTTPPATITPPPTAQFTPEQLKKYFGKEDDVIKFIEELLNILPDEITTQEVGLFINTYIGQLPNHKIKEVKPLFLAMKPLIKKQLAPIYATANTGVKGAEKGGKENAETNDKTINAKN
jgi:hypothetical protein